MKHIDVSLYKWYFLELFCVAVTLFLIFCANHEYLPLTNHYITDSTFYEHHAFYLQYYEEQKIQMFFYSLNRMMYDIGPQTFIIYNTALLLGAVYFCKIFAHVSDQAVSLARAAVVFNPYMLISVTGPTKEINLTFWCLLAMYLFFRPSVATKVLAFMVALWVCAVRPEHGIILAGGMLSTIGFRYFKNPIRVCLYVLGLYFMLNMFPYTRDLILENSGGEELYSFSMSNYYALALVLLEMNKNPLLQFVVFGIKLVLGLFAQIARPNPFMSSVIPLLDIGYSFLGIFIFPLNMSFLLLFFQSGKERFSKLDYRVKLIIIYTFFGMLSTIISPIVQFRYLFPYMPFLAACFYLHSSRARNNMLIVTLVLATICFVLSAIFLPKEAELENMRALPIFVGWI